MDMPRSIIAMKGPPFARKTEIAILIAKSLNCPVLSLADILDALHPDGTGPSPTAAPEPSVVAFDILCRIASSLLFKEVSENVVIDSPLSSQHQLDRLIKMAKSFSVLHPQSTLVIVGCKPRNTFSWKLKFESFLEGNNNSYTRKWYTPKKWDDIERAIRASYDEIHGGYQVSKLVLDPFLDLPNFFDVGPSKFPLLMEAIQYLATLKKGSSTQTVIYHEWQQSLYKKEANVGPQASITRKNILCKGVHCISGYLEEGVEWEANCMACEEQVMGGGAVYTCQDCSLALHKECAESFVNNELRLWELPVSQMLACSFCEEEGKRGSHNCAACLFKTNLKARIMPTVIRHDCEKHFLSLVIPPVKNGGYLCAACGDCDMNDSYSCKICNLAYHYECLTKVPPRVMHEHGGYNHCMQLNFSTAVEEEDYICEECRDWREPQLWYYSCESCPYDVHLYCTLTKSDGKPPPPRFRKLYPKSARGNMPPPYTVEKLYAKSARPNLSQPSKVDRSQGKSGLTQAMAMSYRIIPPPLTALNAHYSEMDVCAHCGGNHTYEKCWELNGYPPWHNKSKNKGQPPRKGPSYLEVLMQDKSLNLQ